MRAYQKCLLLFADAVAVLRGAVHILQLVSFGGQNSDLFTAPYYHVGGFWDYEPFWAFTFWSALLMLLAVLTVHGTVKSRLSIRFYVFGYLWCVLPALWMFLTEWCFIASDAPYPGLIAAFLGCCCNMAVVLLLLLESRNAWLCKTE